MRVLIVGAGGVGTAVVRTVARRDFFEALVIADRDEARAEAAAGSVADPRVGAAAVDASDAASVEDLARRTGATHVLNAVDPRFVMPVFDGALRRRRGLPRHGDEPLPAAPRAALRAARGEARGRAVRAGAAVGGRRPARAGRHRRRTRAVRRLRPLRRRPPLQRDRRARRPRRGEPRRRRLRLRALVLHLDDDRGVPQPAGDLGARPRLVHHRAVQRAGGLRLPGGDRAGRVRQRGARGGPAHAPLGRRPSG